jgi:hypothetical protein
MRRAASPIKILCNHLFGKSLTQDLSDSSKLWFPDAAGELLTDVLRPGLAALRPVRVPVGAVQRALDAFAPLLTATHHLTLICLMAKGVFRRLAVGVLGRLDQAMQPSVELNELLKTQPADGLFDFT